MQQNDNSLPNILIVDDQDDIRSLIEGILQDEGFKTRAAKDSQTAQKLIAEKLEAAKKSPLGAIGSIFGSGMNGTIKP